jgi:hypothetical protein
MVRSIFKVLGVTWVVTPSKNLIVHRSTENGTIVTVHKLYKSKIGRILLNILNK